MDAQTSQLSIGGSWMQGPYEMISGQGEAVSRLLKVATGKSGKRWLYNDDLRDAGSAVYVEGDPNSDGFGGATIPFRLVDGTTLSLKGPWHSNTDALYHDTGIDLRSRHVTWGCIGEGREFRGSQAIITGLIYFDSPGGIEGPFNRVEDLAKTFAKLYGKELCYYSESRGGSSCGFTR